MADIPITQQYEELQKKISTVREIRAVAQAKLEELLTERQQLEHELRDAGIDTGNPEAELQRLTADVNAVIAETERLVTHCETEIKNFLSAVKNS
jgi:chromosome segregation ATPase